MFIDRATVKIQAGKGGNGIVAWRREKYLPKGGPYGGDGGQGASIVVRAESGISSLEWYRHRRTIRAENGQQGGTNRRRGRSGKKLVLKVPCGTLVKDANSGRILFDLVEAGEELLLCKGGRGGRGNASFTTATRQAPNFATPGKIGEQLEVELELKMIADIGLIGFPNAGKSTLLSNLTYTKVKVAPYPFTTLRPNLGFLREGADDAVGRRILVADIPGILEGAHENRGLGIEFLRHIERTAMLLFVLDASGIDGRNPADDYAVLQRELGAYQPELLERPRLVVLNKCDSPEAVEHLSNFARTHPDVETLQISALEGSGIPELLQMVRERMVETTEHSRVDAMRESSP